MRTLLQDLRYGFRVLLQRPGFTAVAVLALALGIGANTAIFSVVNAVLLRALPYSDAGRLVRLYTGSDPSTAPNGPLSYPDLLDYRAQSRTLEYVVGYQSVGTVMLVGGGEAERVRGAEVMADLFPMLGAKAERGRVFTREEDAAGGPAVVVISDGLWRRRFGADPSVVGREVKMGLAGRAATVIGVMPRGFKFPPEDQETIDYYVPFVEENERLRDVSFNNRASYSYPVVAKLRPGVTFEEAAAEVGTIATRLAAEYPDAGARRRARLVSLHEDLVGEYRAPLLVLLGAVGFVLLIACANVANLLLARAASRSKEMAIRTALGAGRLRIARQLLTESLLLALAGGGLGLLLAVWGVDALVRLSPANVPRLSETSLDARVLVFTFAVSLLTGVVFGLVPALQASKTDLAGSLKEGGRGGTSGAARSRLRSLLVVAEVALSLVLLIGAGLFLRSFARLLGTDPGYSPERVLALTVALDTKKYTDGDSRAEFFGRAVEAVRAVPGVEAAAVTRLLPLGNRDTFDTFEIAGRPSPPGERRAARFYAVSPDYFRVMSIPVLRGRAFADTDTSKSPRVMVVNEAFVREFFGGADPTGQRIVLDDADGTQLPPCEIVGVVGSVRYERLNDRERPEFYAPFRQSPDFAMEVVVRSRASDAAALAPPVRAALKGVDGNLLIWETRTMDELVGRSVAPQRFNVALLGVFACVALLLAAVGLYGVIAYTVALRTHEIGIRVALGARPRDVVRMVVGHGMGLTLAGIALGLAGSLALARLVSGLLYGVSATDPPTFILVPLLLAAVALAACLVPARRATKVDPLVALRHE
jgi:putative ABC transport system permease protein